MDWDRLRCISKRFASATLAGKSAYFSRMEERSTSKDGRVNEDGLSHTPETRCRVGCSDRPGGRRRYRTGRQWRRRSRRRADVPTVPAQSSLCSIPSGAPLRRSHCRARQEGRRSMSLVGSHGKITWRSCHMSMVRGVGPVAVKACPIASAIPLERALSPFSVFRDVGRTVVFREHGG